MAARVHVLPAVCLHSSVYTGISLEIQGHTYLSDPTVPPGDFT
jgi:hypothetical protein